MGRRIWAVWLGAALCLGAGGGRSSLPEIIPRPDVTAVEEPFLDVEFGQRWYDAAQYGYRRGLVRGMEENAFGGERTATRAMAVTMVWRLAGEPLVLGDSRFSDVGPEKWYARAVVWAETRALARGYGDGTFGPEDPVTRAQLKWMLERYLGTERVAQAAAMGPGLEEPAGEMSRGELAEVLMELCEEEK